MCAAPSSPTPSNQSPASPQPSAASPSPAYQSPAPSPSPAYQSPAASSSPSYQSPAASPSPAQQSSAASPSPSEQSPSSPPPPPDMSQVRAEYSLSLFAAPIKIPELGNSELAIGNANMRVAMTVVYPECMEVSVSVLVVVFNINPGRGPCPGFMDSGLYVLFKKMLLRSL